MENKRVNTPIQAVAADKWFKAMGRGAGRIVRVGDEFGRTFNEIRRDGKIQVTFQKDSSILNYNFNGRKGLVSKDKIITIGYID